MSSRSPAGAASHSDSDGLLIMEYESVRGDVHGIVHLCTLAPEQHVEWKRMYSIRMVHVMTMVLFTTSLLQTQNGYLSSYRQDRGGCVLALTSADAPLAHSAAYVEPAILSIYRDCGKDMHLQGV